MPSAGVRESRKTQHAKAASKLPEQPDSSGSSSPIGLDNTGSNVLGESTSLSLAGHALPPPKAVAKTLAQFKQVRRLDVSDIQVSESWPDGLRDLDWLVKAVRHSQKARRDEQSLDERLTWLNVSKNPALGQQSDPLQGIEVLTSLFGT